MRYDTSKASQKVLISCKMHMMRIMLTDMRSRLRRLSIVQLTLSRCTYYETTPPLIGHFLRATILVILSHWHGSIHQLISTHFHLTSLISRLNSQILPSLYPFTSATTLNTQSFKLSRSLTCNGVSLTPIAVHVSIPLEDVSCHFALLIHHYC